MRLKIQEFQDFQGSVGTLGIVVYVPSYRNLSWSAGLAGHIAIFH